MPTTPAHAPATRRTALVALLALVWCAATVVTGVVSGATPAYAHAGLVSSTPEEGTTLDAAPTTVELTFNEEVREPAFVVVTAPDGKQQEAGKPVIDGEAVTQTLDPDTEAALHPGGAWTIAYRVVSADGHTVQGHVRFRVTGEAPSPAPPSASPGDDSATAAPRSNGNGADEEDSSNAAPIVLASTLALLLVAVTITQKRRRKE